MPSISQAKLAELTEAAATADRRAEGSRLEAIALRSKVAAFDGILDKIVRASYGQPLVENERSNYADAWGVSSGLISERKKPSEAERHANEVALLHERIVGLESRLAAVSAVAQFAKAHKA